MLKLTDHAGRAHLVAPAAVARITEADTSSQWHGIRSIVRLFDGSVIESADRLADLQAQIAQLQANQPGGE